MKKIVTLVLLLMMAGLALTGCGSTATKAPEQKKIIIGLDDSFPPMGFRDEKNNIVGFDIDMAREAAKRLGMEVEFKAIDWGSKEAELNGKRIDALWNGMNITEKRKENVLFSEPYMDGKQLIFLPKGSTVKSLDDLKGKIVGIQSSSTADEIIEGNKDMKASFKEVRKYADCIAAFMDLQTGRVDGVITDEIFGRYFISKNPDTFIALDNAVGEVGILGIGFRKEDKQLRDKVQKVLDEMKKDGTSAKISKQWFGADLIK
ncbi:MAG: amino acid ABC transporter substrate-binding protein [Sporomusaceae bacterium]|nr:amino acid ABC transporter substrate-binding protein [Sporomusaceae bacterium]